MGPFFGTRGTSCGSLISAFARLNFFFFEFGPLKNVFVTIPIFWIFFDLGFAFFELGTRDTSRDSWICLYPVFGARGTSCGSLISVFSRLFSFEDRSKWLGLSDPIAGDSSPIFDSLLTGISDPMTR